MRRHDVFTLLALALAAAAWLRYSDQPTTANLKRALLRTLPLL